MRDFTTEKYQKLCKSMIESKYNILTVVDYLLTKPKTNFVILRHDVDSRPRHALKMAELEDELGIHSTYYFRSTRRVYNPEIIKNISEMGHEIGYHYEVLSETGGDFKKAIKLFEYELNKFKMICEVKTICMHGSPLSKFDNRDLWKVYNFKDYGIIGEAYLSVWGDFCYFSDSGRNWDWRTKMRDHIAHKKDIIEIKTTEELIEFVKYNNEPLYILVHPGNWAFDAMDWIGMYLENSIFNIGKKFLARVR